MCVCLCVTGCVYVVFFFFNVGTHLLCIEVYVRPVCLRACTRVCKLCLNLLSKMTESGRVVQYAMWLLTNDLRNAINSKYLQLPGTVIMVHG